MSSIPEDRPFTLKRLACVTTLLALALAGAASANSPVPVVIINAQIADGSEAPLTIASVRIDGDRITRIGTFQPRAGEQVLDARGLVLAPGFIDIHNHSDDDLPTHPLAESQIAQGITTVIMGADGSSPWPVSTWLSARRQDPPALNVAMMVGHATVREQVMGEDYKRAARPAEVDRMTRLVEQAMQEGAIGLSSGLEYEVASYATTDEVVAMASVAARSGGFYMTHIRDEADKSFEALREEIDIGERAHIPVEHSHIKLGTVKVGNRAGEYIGIINAVRHQGLDFLADCYPYDAWNSTIKVLVPNKQWQDTMSVTQALADVGGASHVTITSFGPRREYEHHTLEQLAQANHVSPAEMYTRIVREGDTAHTEAEVIGQTMTEADVKAFYQQPWVMVASDGGIGSHHPRGAGTFPRVLGQFVREKHWLTLPQAIHKMSALPARRLGWKDRGVVREGAIADLVLFDPATVIDRASFESPERLPIGIETVFVSGRVVWEHGRPIGARPGRVLPE